jgi:hypothetical protein
VGSDREWEYVVTENARFKKLVRERMKQTDEKYTEARRAVLVECATRDAKPARAEIEAYYAFTPPGTIEHVDAQGSRYLPVPEEAGPGFSWGYHGTGPNTSAWAVLVDSTGSAYPALARAFTDDHLDWWEEIGDREFVITVAEVRAWRAEAEPRVRTEDLDEDDEPRILRLSNMKDRIEAYEHDAATGPRKPWWLAYRDTHGEPMISD